MLVALCGGVGAAKLLRGLVVAVPPADLVPVVNTGDDFVLHGLHISPDLDTVTYTLAGVVNGETGWGRGDDSWRVMTELSRYAGETWFRLGDLDLALHLFRTERMHNGATLAQVTAEVAAAWDLTCVPLPMSDDPVETRVTVEGEEIGFQEYFVARRHAVAAEAIRFAGAADAGPAPGVLEAIASAERVVICPSNPILSIAPILSVPGVRQAVARRRSDTVAVSPIVGGKALKGPADRIMGELGHDVSVVGVARLYADVAATLVVDTADASLAPAVEEEGVRCVVAPTVMHGPSEAVTLARTVIEAGA